MATYYAECYNSATWVDVVALRGEHDAAKHVLTESQKLCALEKAEPILALDFAGNAEEAEEEDSEEDHSAADLAQIVESGHELSGEE